MSASDNTAETGSAYGRLQRGVAELEPVSLQQVMTAAELQTRSDQKYLLTLPQLDQLITATGLEVLEIDSRRVFGYESVYFDTPDLALFRAHRQGRRNRYKVRTRTYLDSEQCVFEVKLKGTRSQTRKHRMAYDMADRGELRPEAQRFLTEVLEPAGMARPALSEVLRNRYHRATLVDRANGVRVTCDVAVRWQAGPTQVVGPDFVIVEVKSASGRSAPDAVLRSLGQRPVSVSKYAIGTALAHPQLAANRWNRALRHNFGWQRHLPQAGRWPSARSKERRISVSASSRPTQCAPSTDLPGSSSL